MLEFPVQTAFVKTEIQRDGLDNCILYYIGTGSCGNNGKMRRDVHYLQEVAA